MKCPLMSYQTQYKNEVNCMGGDCGFADEAGSCLIKQALQCYVACERQRAAREGIMSNIGTNPYEPWEYNWGGVD